VAVRQLTHRGERPGDDPIAAFQAFENLEILFPRDADLHGGEDRLVVAEDEDALGLLAAVPWRRLRRRRRRGCDATLAQRRWLPNERPAGIEEQFAYRERLDRHGHDTVFRGGRDLGGAREARTNVRHLVFDRYHDLEGGRLPLLLRGRLRGLDRAVANLGDSPLERPVRHRIDGLSGRLPERDRRNVGFVHFDFRLEQRHVGDGQEHRPGVVHRADDGRLAFLDVAACHQTVHRRRDDDLIQVVARGREAGTLLADLLLAGVDVLLARLQIGLPDGNVVLCPLECLTSRQAVLPQLLLAAQRRPCQLEHGIGLFHVRARQGERGLRRCHAGLAPFELSGE
jgi:hypothetical protein